MASLIVGALLIGYTMHERKEAKREKKRLAEGQWSQVHATPNTTQSQKQQTVPQLPSYESVVSGRHEPFGIEQSPGRQSDDRPARWVDKVVREKRKTKI